jgi:hypothetical protein
MIGLWWGVGVGHGGVGGVGGRRGRRGASGASGASGAVVCIYELLYVYLLFVSVF